MRLVGAGSASSDPPPAGWTCAFVNNMPDGAFAATERQFIALLEAASGPRPIELRRYAMFGVPRGEQTKALIQAEYRPLSAIWQIPPDLLIVTGSEPLAEELQLEPYWAELAQLLTWAIERVPAMWLSCLSAHAALAIFDGVARQRLATKCTGVFAQEVAIGHPLACGLVSPLQLPHSRLNAVTEEAVTAAGYRAVLRSDATGWGVITKVMGQCGLVLVQGHPEYDPSSLLREYQRDVRRYLLAERHDVPCLPLHCVAPDDWSVLASLHGRLVNGERDPMLLDSFPFAEAAARAEWPWRQGAIKLYRNWLAGVPARSA